MIHIVKKINKKIKNVHFTEKGKRTISFFCVIFLFILYFVLNYSKLIAVYSLQDKIQEETKDMKFLIGGETVGVKLLATGVLVMGIDRTDTNLKMGDIILSVDGKKVESNLELQKITQESNGKELELKVSREDKEFYTKITPQRGEITDEYKLGLWVKDSSAGVGTVTFYEANSNKFAALGHAVTETQENYILPITTGGITKTNIYSIKKGVAKAPGELKGTITNDILGQIYGNTDKGIYGEMVDNIYMKGKGEIEIASKTDIKEGDASIFCTLDDNEVKEYSIKIEKVLLTSTGNKNMTIKITDEKLLEKTGGIIQGMSGSPIVQDGKLIGAVTHVFLNDPTRGYGVFIENMIEDMNNVE
ncbi:MAG: SpoIVB peptidase [Clostridia bacterium]|nr:SpoIVB peptidase [Clostridia bacterium]